MGVSTRKRAVAAADDPPLSSANKRSRVTLAAASPARGLPGAGATAGSPKTTPPKQAAASVPKKGSRGAAFLAAAGIAVPGKGGPVSPPRLSTKKESATKAARLAADAAAAPAAVRASPGRQRNPLLGQALPRKLAALLDMFAGLQNVYEMMRKRGQRTTFQHMRAAVEEASGRRFLLPHVAQLKHLLPEALELEWVRLPVAAHSSRTEPHLLISLDVAAAATAAAAAGAAHAGGELQSARALLHCRLAGHLLDSYRGHLEARAEELREAGDGEGAEHLAAAHAAAAQPPVAQFVPPYPEAADDVPQQQLPQRPEVLARGGSPVVLAGAPAGAAGGAAQLAVPSTPATTGIKPPPSATTGRQGRPPMHPNTVERHRLQQRRLSFGTAVAAAAAEASAAVPSRAALAAASAGGQPGVRAAAKSGSPLDKLVVGLEQPGSQAQQALEQQVHPKQAALAASLAAGGGLDFGFGETVLPEGPADDAILLASMPEELRRMSTDGIISMDTLRKLDAAEQQHRRLSSKEAQAARESSMSLGQLPRTFSRLQRIFGFQGPNALKLRDVVLRIKQGAETSSEAQIEAQLRALSEHAPEFLTLKPYGACGTPALWVNRRCNANAIMARLREVAEARRSSVGA